MGQWRESEGHKEEGLQGESGLRAGVTTDRNMPGLGSGSHLPDQSKLAGLHSPVNKVFF